MIKQSIIISKHYQLILKMRTAMIGLVKQAGLGVAPEQAGHGD